MNECIVNQKEFQEFKVTVGIVKWIGITVIGLLTIITGGLTTAVWQSHLLKIEVVLLKDAFDDHLLEQKNLYGNIIGFFANEETEDEEDVDQKQTYVAGTE
jgi:hypothetical protein